MHYSNYAEMKQWELDSFGVYDSDTSHYFKSELKRHGVECQGIRALEFGFGNGAFLNFARDHGAEIVGVEVQEILLERAEKAGFQVYKNLSDIEIADSPHSFDLIAAFDVFEHLSPEESISTLAQMKRLAKPGALLIARFPNGDSPFSMPLQHGDYTHKMALGKGSVNQIFYQGGWDVRYLGEPTWAFLNLGSRIKHSFRHALRRAFEKFVMTLYFGKTHPATFYHNYFLAASPSTPKTLPTQTAS